MERLLERMGYSITALDKATGSYLLSGAEPDPSRRSVVQLRRSTSALEAAEVRALQSAVRHERADTGLLFTTSGLGPQAYEYAHGRPLRMFDGHSVLVLCQRHGLPARIESPAQPELDADRERSVPAQRHDRTPSGVDR